MKYQRVCIESLGVHLPDEIVSSAEIEERLGETYQRFKLPEGRLEMMTGIRERRFFPSDWSSAEVSSIAGRNAMEKSGIDPSLIGCLIHASVCKDRLEPATATAVHASLGLRDDCIVYDISNACLGVLNGMINIADMIELGHIDAGLVVAGENGRSLVEATIKELQQNKTLTRQSIKPHFASLTIGAGACAVLLVNEKISKGKHHLSGGSVFSSTHYNDLCQGGENGNASEGMNTNSEELLKRGVELAERNWKKMKETLNWSNETADHIFIHQVGEAHRNLLYKTLHLDVAKDFETYPWLGNMGSASLPVTASLAEEAGKLKKGGKSAWLGIGSGINSLMLGVEW